MKSFKLLRTPYPYIFFLTYAGVWLMWDLLKLPFSNPGEVVSYLPSIHYNPNNNLLRFAAAVLLPPLACGLYWWLSTYRATLHHWWARRNVRYALTGSVLTISLLIAMAIGIAQVATNPDKNQPDLYGQTYRYAQVDTFHEGETLGPAISYSDPHSTPYKDFVIVHGVFQDPVRTVLAFKLFGKSIGASRAMAVILSMAAFALFYLLIYLLFRRDLVRSTIAFVFFSILSLPATVPFIQTYIMPTAVPSRDIATILFLAAAVVGFRWYEGGKHRWAAAASGTVGFVAVASFANSLDRAIYIFVLALAWLVMMLAIVGRQAFWKAIAMWWLLGAVIGFGVLLVALKGELGGFWQYVMTITQHKELLDGMPFRQPVAQVTVILLIISAAIAGAGFWFLRSMQAPLRYAHSFGQRVWTAGKVAQKAIREHHTLILLGLTALLFMRNALGRALMDHFYYSVPWLWVFVVYFVLVYLYPVRKKIGFAIGFLALTALLLMAGVYAGWMKRLDFAADVFPVHIKDTEVVRKDYLQTADYLKKHLHGDETFATLTSEGVWYYLVDKPTPLQYPIIWYAFTKSERTKLAEAVEHNPNLKYLVTNHQWTTNFDYVPNEQRFPELYEAVNRLYVPHVGFGDQTVWIRK